MRAKHGAWVRVVVPAALLLAAAGATAADEAGDAAPDDGRSIASAQAFLQQMLPGNRYVSTPMAEIHARARNEGVRASFDPLPVIVEADPVEPCVSRLRADASGTWLLLRNPQDYDDATDAPLADLLGGPLIGDPEGMHFGSVRALRRVGTEVRIRLAGNSDDAVLHLDAESTAKRVHDALEYLRLHCDATRATGF